ncbi:MAG: preprotein translocase subunit SecA, partial [Bacteroidetes bacterium HGW-Bacteroidetes-22]
MLSILKKFFGTKSNRDLKEILPLVDKIHEAYEKIAPLSNDELRALTQQFRERINTYIGEEDQQILSLRERIDNEPEMDVHEREKLYQMIDSLKKSVIEKTEQILLEILPEAFSVMKETARRFKENEWVEVTATERDRDLATVRENIVIEGDKARYRNSWMAGGTL